MAQPYVTTGKMLKRFLPLGTTPTKTLMNEDAAPLGIDMISIRASDTHLSKPGDCTVFISPKHYSDIN